MKFMYSVTFCIFLGFNFGCKTKSYTPTSYTKRMLYFGGGGGFTGAVKSFYILENGQAFKAGMESNSFNEIAKLDSKVVKQIFANYDNLNLAKMELNEPQNMYKFIEHQDANGKHKLMWGRLNKDEAHSLDIFYSILLNAVKDKNPVK